MISNKGQFVKGNIPWNKGKKDLFIGEKNPFYGKHHTEKTKWIISEKEKGKHKSPQTEFKNGIIPWNKGLKGMHFSPETEFKKGIIPWMKGKTHTKEARKKISKANFDNPKKYWMGKNRSEKTKKIISATKQGILLTEWKKFIAFEQSFFLYKKWESKFYINI